MKASPCLIFNGNCAEAIKLYEKAFGTKATSCQYKDSPPPEGFPLRPKTAELVMHGALPIGNETIYLCDTTPDKPATFGNGAFACVELDDEQSLRSAFDVMKEGWRVFLRGSKNLLERMLCRA